MRPNILLIHSDQHRFDCLGVNGHPLLRTPHLDRLAAEGVNFTHAFTPTAICSPARASLMTGQWPTQHGCLSIPGPEIYQPANPALPTFSKLLHSAGYRLGFVGKYHHELPGTPLDYGFETYHSLAEYKEWRQHEQKLPPKPRQNGWFGELDPDASPEQTAVGWGATRALDLIDRYRRQPDTPWFVRWDPQEPHLPNVLPEPYHSMYPPHSIEPWSNFTDPLIGKPYIQHQQLRTWEVEGWSWDRWAPLVSRYLGQISLLDAQIGRLLTALDDWGLAENTLVIYSTDHGDLCGAHGMMDKHFIMYDDVMRVPLILRWPAHLKPDSSCDAFVVHELDLATTFCQVAGLDVPETFEGRSLIDVANSTDPTPRQDVFGVWHGAQFGSYTQRMVRDRRWKYIYNMTAGDELYDLANDPGECLNLATDPSHASDLSRLRHRLVAWMDDIHDPMINPWTRRQLLQDLKK